MFNNVKKLFYLFFSVVFAISCQKQTRSSKNPVPIVLSTLKQLNLTNVAYGSDPAQIMDVYLPKGRNIFTTKVIIMIHGGGWVAGDKSSFNGVISALMPRLPDYAFFNINYRLATPHKNQYPAALEDVGTAINYIRSQVSYCINTSKLVLGGESAGANLAMLQGYNQNTDLNVEAVIDISGPSNLYWTDLNVSSLRTSLSYFLGPLAKDSASYIGASPLSYVSASSPPTIIFQGTADVLVPIIETESLVAKLNLYDVHNKFVVEEGAGHNFNGDYRTDVYNKIVEFLNQYVN